MFVHSLILFSDLDGALLDHHTYSAREAKEALERVRRCGAPLIFCTSKTREEVETLRRRLGNRHPFITENGGGVFIPRGYFATLPDGAAPAGGYDCLALGRPYSEIVEQLKAIAEEAEVQVIGFHQMSAREIAEKAGLSSGEAELARAREFDEPFFFVGADEGAKRRFAQLVKHRGLGVCRGDRFWHLYAGTDKGRACRELARLYRAAGRSPMRTVALGSGANDLPMLAFADLAVLLPAPGGRFDSEVLSCLPRVRLGPAPGPRGWNQVVLEILEADKAELRRLFTAG